MIDDIGSPLPRVVMIGDSGAGKTSLLNRLARHVFESAGATVGNSCVTLSLGTSKNQVQLWDTAGQERFRSITSVYLRNASAAVCVFDVTSRESWESVDGWLELFEDIAGPKRPVLVVANKIDMEGSICVDTDEAERTINRRGCLFACASAKTGDGVEAAFARLGTTLEAFLKATNEQVVTRRAMLLEDPGTCKC